MANPFRKKKPKEPWRKCPATWQEKFMKDGRWVHVTRHCTKQAGHSGRHG